MRKTPIRENTIIPLDPLTNIAISTIKNGRRLYACFLLKKESNINSRETINIGALTKCNIGGLKEPNSLKPINPKLLSIKNVIKF